MKIRRSVLFLLAALLGLSLTTGVAGAAPSSGGSAGLPALHSLREPVTDENFYFLMADRFENGSTANDRGGIDSTDRLVTGFDPTSRAFYNGGDLIGLRNRIDYIRGLGTTSIWLTPSFKNKAVQLEDGPSAGYHGYWVTDFTQIDPHLGSNADLQALVTAAHQRGMKVYFDIITNHTADVIGYQSGARQPYVSKDVSPYRSASGVPFDDRDYAGTNSFPALDPAASFPYVPVLDPAEQNLRVPAWLNDVTLYHNRGDTRFTGENAFYGDFFGLDDLFTEHPRVVRGMIDIYKAWIRDFGIDGFRIDTMKHVDDKFWQQFGPEVLRYAKEQGKKEFFMFGEVFDTSKAFTSHFSTTNRMQAVLDFPFQDAARKFSSQSQPAANLSAFFRADDWYTDADSNAYQLPTFLGNHDMGRIGSFLRADNPGASDAELLARDQLAHALMFFSRGNPVVYYGDEQGFVGRGGDQGSRQSMFASQVPEYQADDLIGTDSTPAQSNFVTSHPLYRSIQSLTALTAQHPALRNGVQQDRFASSGPGIYAFSRIDRGAQREYIVALNNSEQPQSATVPTYDSRQQYDRIYGSGPSRLRSGTDSKLSVTVPALSVVVYQSKQRIPGSKSAPSISLNTPAPSAEASSRVEVSANIGGSSLYEVTFYAKVGNGRWIPIGTDDNAPYRVFHDVSALAPNTPLQYQAVVLDNKGHTRTSQAVRSTVPLPRLVVQTPLEGARVRDAVQVEAVTNPDRADQVVRFERQVADGAWTPLATDSSSPVFSVTDTLPSLAQGTQIRYRVTLTQPGGISVSTIRSVTAAGPPATVAELWYFRPAGDYGSTPNGWGLHLWGDAVDPAVLTQIAWERPWQLARITDGWAVYEIPLVDDTKPVNFILHLPSGDVVPETREPGGDRSFVPLNVPPRDQTGPPTVWLIQGDPTVYTTRPPSG